MDGWHLAVDRDRLPSDSKACRTNKEPRRYDRAFARKCATRWHVEVTLVASTSYNVKTTPYFELGVVSLFKLDNVNALLFLECTMLSQDLIYDPAKTAFHSPLTDNQDLPSENP